MPAKESLPVSMHTYASRPYNTYFGNAFRVMEFSACILFYIAITCLQAISIDNTQMKGVIAQIQAFIAIYLVLRYTFLGLSVMLTCNLLELINIFFSLVNVGDNSILIIALTVKLFTVSSIIIVCMLQVKQNKQKRELHRLVNTDDLTDTYNRRFFYSTLDKLVEDTKKNNSSVGLILIDIDNFKSFNDNYGHDSGDKVLKATSNLLKDFAYDKDFVFRYAGDQFAILVPSVNLDSLQQKAEQLKETLYIEKNRYYEGYIGQDITLSMGLSVYPMVAKSMDELVSQADTALYHAKNLGKDKVNSYHDIIHHISGSTSFSDKQLIGLFKALLSSISAKDKYTFGHSERVSQYAGIIGDEMKLDPRDISILRYAGLFHDIGKIEVPTSILNKIEPLSQDEFRILRMHPVYSANILEPLGEMDQLIDFVKHHHERYDGTGYPDKLSGSRISLGARILCVADSFDAMLSERPYGKRRTIEEAFEELDRCSGTQFDPEIAIVFKRAFAKTNLYFDRYSPNSSTEMKSGKVS